MIKREPPVENCRMDDRRDLAELRRWLTEAGLASESETALLDGFCGRARMAGLPLTRAAFMIDTLHPVHEGRLLLAV
jgi:adenylate cyclase